eukprot:jgi/Pico_ML_1/51723/g289.t1
MAAHREFLNAMRETYDELWAEYLKIRWANQQLRLYGGSTRVLATILKHVAREAAGAAGKPLVVAYSTAKFALSGRGKLAAPTSRAFKECVQRFKPVLVDELRTTVVHMGGGGGLIEEAGLGQAAVKRLMWCGSTNGKFATRDLNFALNIRMCQALSVWPAKL